ncbi:sporulation integral membrane protein YtvI [Romboutsia sp.]|uniref:sporulation integral membrane protein YtvI n=1 Tax=Romboutsia sp. TaxID=1965302 RepID=UPI003F3118ED
MKVEKKRDFIINVLYTVIVTGIVFIAIKYGLVWFLPFVIGFLVAFILKPSINFISRKTQINRKPIAALVVLIFYGTVGVLITMIGFKLAIAIRDIFIHMPGIYSTSIEPAIFDLFKQIEEIIAKLNPEMVKSIQDMSGSMLSSLASIVSNISKGVIGIVSSMLSSIPTFFITVLFTIISSFFFSIDYPKITGFIVKQFSPRGKSIIFDIKNYIVGTIFKFIKAYSILLSITFIELSIGLSILGVNDAIAVAALIAILDIFPVVGTGGILMPWALIELIRGNVYMALGILIIYVIVLIVRNILEPKIVGQQIGLHPVLMLMCIFIGVKLFGFMGLFILPIIAIIVKSLNDNGKINLYK